MAVRSLLFPCHPQNRPFVCVWILLHDDEEIIWGRCERADLWPAGIGSQVNLWGSRVVMGMCPTTWGNRGEQGHPPISLSVYMRDRYRQR